MHRTMQFFAVILISLFASTTSAAANENSTRDTKGKYLDVLEDGRVIARYMYAHDLTNKDTRHETYKPYLHVMGPDGKAPITKGPGGQFTHHRGIFLGWSKIKFQGKSFDLWHMKTSEIIHKEFVTTKSNDKSTTVQAKLHWMDNKGQVILEELRTMVFDHSDSSSFFNCEFTCELKAVTDDVELNGDPEHAGFQYRPSNDVSKNKSAKYLFHKDGINPKKDKDLPWVALNYQLGGKSYSVVHMNHPANPKGSIYSAYRDYGRFGSFPKASLKKGESLKLRYKIKVAEGGFPERESVEKIYKQYVAQ